MKSKGTAYLLWLISIFGWLGFHHFYLGKVGKGIIWILTGGVFGLGSLIDLFTLGGAVDNYNTNKELKTIRAASMAAATSASSAAAATVASLATNKATSKQSESKELNSQKEDDLAK